MFDVKVETLRDKVLESEIKENSFAEELTRVKSRVLSLREAKVAGEGNFSPGDLSQAIKQQAEVEGDLEAARSLTVKAKNKLCEALERQRKAWEVEKQSFLPAINRLHKECRDKLTEVLVESQVLINLIAGQRQGNDLLFSVSHYIRGDYDHNGPDPYIVMAERANALTRERYDKSPLHRRDEVINALSICGGVTSTEEAEKLLEEGRKRLTKKE